jgi:hypothetical protein
MISRPGLEPKPKQLGLWARIGLLQINVPIVQILKLDRFAGYRAAHETPWAQDSELAIEIFELGFSRANRGTLVKVHGLLTLVELL